MNTEDSVPLLQVSQVSHHYGAFRAVDEANLEIQGGQVHCLLGPSGSGKSTLLRLTAGLETLQQGKIMLEGQTVAAPGHHVRPEHRSVGLVFQDYALFPHLSVIRNVMFGMSKVASKKRPAQARLWLERVGMEAYAEAMPHTLSGGQQQRVALARSLAREPVVMLLDEPFSGLDVRLRREVREVTLDILQNAGVATLMVTHDPQEALKAGDRISVIREGKIVQTGTPDEIYHRSADRRVAEIFGQVNVLRTHLVAGRLKTELGSFDVPQTHVELAEGAEMEALIRPEDLRLDESPYGSACKAEITALEPGSGTLQVRLETSSGLRLSALESARSRRQVGDRVYVSVEQDALMAYPADS